VAPRAMDPLSLIRPPESSPSQRPAPAAARDRTRGRRVQRVLDGLFEDGHGRQKKRTRRRRQRLGRDVSAANEETALFRDSKRRGDLLDGHGQCHTDDDASHTGMTPMMVALEEDHRPKCLRRGPASKCRYPAPVVPIAVAHLATLRPTADTREGHRHDTTVSKLDDERAISDANVFGCRCLRRND